MLRSLSVVYLPASLSQGLRDKSSRGQSSTSIQLAWRAKGLMLRQPRKCLCVKVPYSGGTSRRLGDRRQGLAGEIQRVVFAGPVVV